MSRFAIDVIEGTREAPISKPGRAVQGVVDTRIGLQPDGTSVNVHVWMSL
jgi:hypothetical protein